MVSSDILRWVAPAPRIRTVRTRGKKPSRPLRFLVHAHLIGLASGSRRPSCSPQSIRTKITDRGAACSGGRGRASKRPTGNVSHSGVSRGGYSIRWRELHQRRGSSSSEGDLLGPLCASRKAASQRAIPIPLLAQITRRAADTARHHPEWAPSSRARRLVRLSFRCRRQVHSGRGHPPGRRDDVHGIPERRGHDVGDGG